MKVITKMTGLRLLEEIVNNNLSCGTMIRCKNQNISDAMEIPIYEYYIFTKNDGRFHRCDENGKLGVKGQNRFMNYGTLTKEFEIVEIIEVDEDPTEREKIFENIYRQNKMLHKAIYDYLGEPYEYKNGKITPISQLKKDKDIEEIEYIVRCNSGYEDERLNKDFSNLCNKVNINTLKINELIRKIKNN